MSKIGKAFLSLILDKKARAALENAAQQPKAVPNPAAPPPRPTPQQSGRHPGQHPAPPQQAVPQPSLNEQLHAKLAAAQNRPRPNESPSRQQLIQNAMRVRTSKQGVLEDLSQEQRLKLQVMAMKAMLPKNQSR